MKVITDHTDGHWSMVPAEERQPWQTDEDWAWYQGRIVEISDEEYAGYIAYLDLGAMWAAKIRILDNQGTP